MENIIHGPPYTTVVPDLTLGQLYFECCRKYSDRICQIDATTGESESYGSVLKRSVRLALLLQKLGITKKDVVATCCGNTLDTIIPILATNYLCAKNANFEPSLSVKQLEHLLVLVEPKLIFLDDSSFDLINAASKVLKYKLKIIKFSNLREWTTPQENEDGFVPIRVDPMETAFFLFTSGTTGSPKAICVTSSAFMHIIAGMSEAGWGGAMFHITRFYWITSHFVTVGAFFSGGYRVFAQTPNVELLLKSFEKYQIQNALISTTLLPAIVNFEKAKDFDYSSMYFIAVVGNVVSTNLLQKVTNVFNGVKILFSFGMSEGGLLSFDPKLDKELIHKKTNSCGKVYRGLQVKIVDLETKEALGPNQKGELCFKGPMIFKSYYKLDSSSAFDSDGFFKTGDVAYYDDDHCFYVVERIKEMFKFRGWHIVPSFLEGVLLEHPAVLEAGVFGIAIEDEGEAPAAVVVLIDGCHATKEELEEFVARKVPDKEQLIGGVFFTDKLPRTSTGKLLRKELKGRIKF